MAGRRTETRHLDSSFLTPSLSFSFVVWVRHVSNFEIIKKSLLFTEERRARLSKEKEREREGEREGEGEGERERERERKRDELRQGNLPKDS